MKKASKIGIIQNLAITADLSSNLRQIVQSYRDCIDRGAELVLAPAFALTGPQLNDLSQRESFLVQNQRALELLASETTLVPLLLGSYSYPLVDEDEIALCLNNESATLEYEALLCPFLLEDGFVNQLEDGETTEIVGLRVYVSVSERMSVIELDSPDLIVELSTSHWFAGLSQEVDENICWQAKMNDCPLAYLSIVGYANEYCYAGASRFCNAQGKITRILPAFESSQCVVALSELATCPPLMPEDMLLRNALVHALRQHCNQFAYNGICINLDLKHSKLLCFLAVEAVGASKVHALSFNQCDYVAEKSLGIHFRSVDELFPSDTELETLSLQKRMQAAYLSSYADKEGLLVVAGLNRHQILLGEYTSYAEGCAQLLPFGSLYDIDLYMLIELIHDERVDYYDVIEEAPQAELDRILHTTMDENISSGDLLQMGIEGIEEDRVRYVQRRVNASAEKAHQLPPLLHLENPEQLLQIPAFHRLID